MAEKMPQTVKRILPGVLVVTCLGGLARLVHLGLPADGQNLLGDAVLALALGLLASNFFILPSHHAAGIHFCYKRFLPIAIVLLGSRLSFQAIADIGGYTLILICCLIGLALWMTRKLGNLTGLSPRIAALIGLGAAVCGNTAITVAAPAIGAEDEEVSFAIATNTLFGTLAVFLFPLIGHSLGLGHTFFGIWAGTAVNDTSQVVAAGFSYSPEAGELATAVKLTRNALMGFVIVLVTLLFANRSATTELGWAAKIKKSMPLFVVGFVIMALLNSLGLFSGIEERSGFDLRGLFSAVSKFLILLALAAIGLQTRFTKLRQLGWSPLLVGLATSLTLATLSFCFIRWFILA